MKKLISFVVAAAVALPVSVMAQVKEDVLTKYAKPSQFLDIKISPEGNYLAATSRTDEGKVRLTVLDINDKKVLSMTEGQGNESVASFNWANDDRLVMSMAREVGSLDAPIPTGEIFAMDADGGNQKILTGPRSDDGDYRFAQIIDF
ncbi:MAG: S9 family peptidase, partial [Pseudomonadota bacterium]|nr:S9 family peptidase [Pseudomonadota bacterium]